MRCKCAAVAPIRRSDYELVWNGEAGQPEVLDLTTGEVVAVFDEHAYLDKATTTIYDEELEADSAEALFERVIDVFDRPVTRS